MDFRSITFLKNIFFGDFFLGTGALHMTLSLVKTERVGWGPVCWLDCAGLVRVVESLVEMAL